MSSRNLDKHLESTEVTGLQTSQDLSIWRRLAERWKLWLQKYWAVLGTVQAGPFPKRSLEFRFYACEEVGLVGSDSVALKYYQENVYVVAMLNFDMVGYHEEGVNDIGIYADFGNHEVRQLIMSLLDNYLDFGWRDVSCGYDCSDHASWNMTGYPSAMAGVVKSHPDIHTSEDSIDYVNMVQVKEFIKLAIGFAVEVAEMEV